MNSAPLGKFCEVIMGQAPPGESYNETGSGLPLIAGAGDFGERTPEPTRFTTATTKRSRVGDIIICIRATIGDLNWSDDVYCLGRGVASVRPISGQADSSYVWWALDHYKQTLASLGRGATFKQVNRADLGGLDISLPSLAEQRRIAATLDQADGLRRKRRETLCQLNKLSDAIFVDLFGDPTNLGPPSKTAALGEVCDVRDGTHESPSYVEHGPFLLTSKNFSSGKLDLRGAKRISVEDFNSISRRSKVDVGDIVMPMIGTIGSPVLIEEEPDFAIKNVALFKFAKAKASANYVHAFLSGPFLKRKVAEAGRGGTQQFLSLGDLRGLRIPIPSPRDERLFGDRKSALVTLRRNVERHLIFLDALFASLQYRAFRGEL